MQKQKQRCLRVWAGRNAVWVGYCVERLWQLTQKEVGEIVGSDCKEFVGHIKNLMLILTSVGSVINGKQFKTFLKRNKQVNLYF